MAYKPVGNAENSEVKYNRMKKYDQEVESAVLSWIAGVLGEPNLFAGVQGPHSVQGALKSGVILCKLMNKINSGAIPKFHQNPKMPFLMMENIGFFNEAMRAYGVQPEYLFVTADLYDGDNMVQVLIGLRALGRKATENDIRPGIRI